MPGLALFDLDNTLFDRDGAFRRWCSDFIGEHHLDPSAIHILLEADGGGSATRSEFFTAVKAQLGLSDTVEALIEGYRTRYPRHYRRDPETLACLVRLRQAGWKLAVVTNGPPTQVEKIRLTGLAPALDAWCISEVVGVDKPHPGIFEQAARRCGVPLQGWMTGDSAEADIAGGIGVGLRTIWLSSDRAWRQPAYVPEAIATTVGEAVDIILAADTQPD